MKLLVFVIFLVIAFLHIPAFEMSGSFAYVFSFCATLSVIFLVTVYKRKTTTDKNSLKLLMWAMLPYIFAFLFSAFFHGFNERACLTIMYWFIVVLTALLSTRLIQEKAVYYLWCGYVIAFLTHIVHCFFTRGVVTLNMLELHEISFAMGVVCIYFFIADKHRYKREIVVSVIFILLAYKRIELFALFVCFLVYCCNLQSETKKMCRFFCVILLFFMGYAYFCWGDGFRLLMEYFNVDSVGRTEIYSLVLESLKGPDVYRGRGIGWTLTSLTDIYGNWRGYSDLHNDYLKYLVELGVFGGSFFGSCGCLFLLV